MKHFFQKLFGRTQQKPTRSADVSAATAEDPGYAKKILQELSNFRNDFNVHELPPIFHYWSGKYLAPKLNAMGFEHPDDFFAKSLARSWRGAQSSQKRFISVGAGNCDTEVRIAKRLVDAGFKDFVIECMDINAEMLERGSADAIANGVQQHIAFIPQDFNTWRPSTTYDAVIANHSLHHVLELEHLFDAVGDALTPGARFIVADMIGRNGHQLWPEALTLVNQFWSEMPDSYRYNHQLKRNEPSYMDWDCSSSGFEGVRAQDILPLLTQRFEFELFLPFANIVQPFIGRGFGHNFKADQPWDRDFVDRVHAADEAAMLSGRIKPTQMFAVLTKSKVESPQFLPGLAPGFCVRLV